MTAIKDILKGLVKKGKVTHEVTVQGSTFELRTISTEEQFLVETMTSVSNLKDKYEAAGEISSYVDTLTKMRNLSLLTLSIHSIDGVEVVNDEATPGEKFKLRLEFRDELSELPSEFIDELLKGYRELSKKNAELYRDFKENVGK